MILKQNIKLKNIKICNWQSEETYCFQAKVFYNDKPFAYVSNDGHGGSNDYSIIEPNTQKDFDNLNELIGKSYPKPFEDSDMQYCLECLIGDLLNEYLDNKEKEKLKKYLINRFKKNILYLKNNSLMVCKFKNKKDIGMKELDYFFKMNPNAICLNLLPINKAIETYNQYAK